jgi:hypothetical protein
MPRSTNPATATSNLPHTPTLRRKSIPLRFILLVSILAIRYFVDRLLRSGKNLRVLKKKSLRPL